MNILEVIGISFCGIALLTALFCTNVVRAALMVGTFLFGVAVFLGQFGIDQSMAVISSIALASGWAAHSINFFLRQKYNAHIGISNVLNGLPKKYNYYTAAARLDKFVQFLCFGSMASMFYLIATSSAGEATQLSQFLNFSTLLCAFAGTGAESTANWNPSRLDRNQTLMTGNKLSQQAASAHSNTQVSAQPGCGFNPKLPANAGDRAYSF